ncbi:fluoride efflux transporter FluC [Mycetocola spongiae]|uniref:fluoride efflux transporter FluC n=1 Tax=Mycetocola spongiae TaxID=2859226 RepID=UPI001CF47814|nr:CrcB family protein [Mycetocola spongiae]
MMPIRAFPPLHTVALVFLGGTLGVAARALLGEAFPASDGLAWITILINISGAFALGLLLEALIPRPGEAESPRSRTLRLLLGTGVLGGFTTFSALAVDTVHLLTLGRPLAALAYALGSVLCGAVAAWLGILLGARLARKRGRA